MAGPLAGVKVLDLCRVAAGPQLATLLARLGAEVVKIEPLTGEPNRTAMADRRNVGVMYLCANTGKRSAMVDLKHPEGLRIVLRLAERSHVFLANWRPGALERAGVGYEDIAKVNPKVVYFNLAGYGHTGPLVQFGSVDPQIQAISGFASLNGQPGDRAQIFRGWGILDMVSAYTSVPAILAAVYRQKEKGIGEKIETAMLEAALFAQTTRLAAYLNASNGMPRPMGSARDDVVPDQVFQTQDGYIAVSVTQERQWKSLCRVLEIDEIADDPQFSSNVERVRHRDNLIPLLESLFSERPAPWWRFRLARVGVPCQLLGAISHLWEHPQVMANRMMVEVDHGAMGQIKQPGPPWRLSRSSAIISPAPISGEHTHEVLGELGYAEKEIGKLEQTGVIKGEDRWFDEE